MSIKNYLQEFKHEIELVSPYRYELTEHQDSVFVDSCIAYATFIKPLVWSDFERLQNIRNLRIDLQQKYKLKYEPY